MTEVIVRSEDTPADATPPVTDVVEDHSKQIETLGMLHVDDAVRTDTRFDELTDRLARIEETMAAKGKPADPPEPPMPEPDMPTLEPETEPKPDESDEPDKSDEPEIESEPETIDPEIPPGEEGSPYAPGQNPFGAVETVEEEVVATPDATKKTKRKTTIREKPPKAATKRSDKLRRALLGGSGGVKFKA